MCKVSVIVPTYNVENYIEKCLESLVNQTLRNIEIICIDDCSNDKTLQILKSYAKNDNRIKIVEQEKNQGVSVARNIGIQMSRGEYIGFIDSDDWVDLDFYEKLYNKTSNNLDIIKGSMYRVFPKKNAESTKNEIIKKNKYNFYGEFYTAIYNSRFLKINNIRFPEDILTSEDIVFSIQCICKCKNIDFVDNAYYYYLQRVNSKVKTLNNQKVISCLNSCERILSLLNNNDIDEKNYKMLVNKIIFGNILERLLNSKDLEDSVSTKIKDFYTKLINKLKYNIDFDFEQRYKFYKKQFYNNGIEKIFSIKKINSYEKEHILITILGLKLKLKNTKKVFYFLI